jgi:hypothetical protein
MCGPELLGQTAKRLGSAGESDFHSVLEIRRRRLCRPGTGLPGTGLGGATASGLVPQPLYPPRCCAAGDGAVAAASRLIWCEACSGSGGGGVSTSR